ncbi:RHS repeat-associated core domain-containing protein [Pseudomonas vancouverensis]|uniref:RHS repeat-associated core domain-containing protein n=1 Tax=Pseudomonas vancouverensis TaxID=95300 RepID=A0A1H2PEB0_PSEVA|nr:RHS repeat-associated core domain-containing protein [Pseudomonas vancouverensis]KAB0497959.1 RHS repeat-associated core domain-containing protein [Pseudomonas vancouverensis]TDB66686.1 RHS repeat-associated core domain-containing protein [Pseudomonas vancouverensis]SDV15645.1 RHS repeat-associated core domain-containing protein [Pseudomonas vancouverensis]
MLANAQYVLCRYYYDPLDRLIGTNPTNNDRLQRFYCRSRLVTEIQGRVQHSIFQQGDQLLTQKSRQDDSDESSILATDQMRSVLQVVKASGINPIVYAPYGYRSTDGSLLSLLGFNGEQADSFTGFYLLGNGYRAFNPVLKRFNSPDNMSPFGAGGINSYAYCSGDPVNRYDDNGHWPKFLKSLFNAFKKSPSTSPSPVSSPNITRKFTLYENFYARAGDEKMNVLAFKSYRKNPKHVNRRFKLPPKEIKSPKDLE